MEGRDNTDLFADAEAYGYNADNTSPQESQDAKCQAATPIYTPVVDALEFHPLANIFPLLEGEEFDHLVTDIRRNGLREPIVLTPDGRILDGRNCYLACRADKLKPWFVTAEDLAEKWRSFVISKNIRRRHLTASQRAAVAAELVTATLGDNQHNGGSAKLPRLDRSKAAKLFNTSTRSVGDAVTVKNHSADLHDLVKAGKVPVDVAARMVRGQPETIDSFIEETKAGKAPAKPRLQLEAKEPMLVRDPAPENDSASEKKPLTPEQSTAIWNKFSNLLAMAKRSTYQNERKNARRCLCGIMIDNDFTHNDIPRWIVRRHFGTPAQCKKCTQKLFSLSAEG